MLPFDPDPVRRFHNQFAKAKSRWERFRLASGAHEAGEAAAAKPAREIALDIFRAAERSDNLMEFAPGSMHSPARWLARHSPGEAVVALASLIKANSDSAAMAAEEVVAQLGHDALPLYQAAGTGPCSYYCLLGLVRGATVTAKPSPALTEAAAAIADRMFRDPHPRVIVSIVTTNVRLGAGRWLSQLREIQGGTEIAAALLAHEFLLAHREGGDAAVLAALDRFGFGLPRSAFARMEWPSALRPAVAEAESRLAPCVRLRTTTGPAGTKSPSSQLGGVPLLSAQSPWPSRDDCYYLGRIGQDVFAAAGQPAFGPLQFWVESGSFEDGGFMDCDSIGIVAPVAPNATATAEQKNFCPWNPCAVRFEPCLSLDTSDDVPSDETPAGQLHRDLEILARGIRDDRFEHAHQIGGHVSYDGRCAIEAGDKNGGVPLLLLAADQRMGLGFSDTGCLVFSLTPGEFAAADIRKVGAGISFA